MKTSNGKISVDNRELIDQELLLENSTSYVPQNIFLINESIKKNIAFGIPENKIDIERVIESINQAQLKTFVETLPKGIETKIGERGSLISGGQIQRIGIARALYRKPDLIIFDEATSALDNKTEKEIMETIKKISNTKTVILITHKNEILNFCNKIFRISNGKLEDFK